MYLLLLLVILLKYLLLEQRELELLEQLVLLVQLEHKVQPDLRELLVLLDPVVQLQFLTKAFLKPLG
jgi:hypothetical protein